MSVSTMTTFTVSNYKPHFQELSLALLRLSKQKSLTDRQQVCTWTGYWAVLAFIYDIVQRT